LADELIDSRLAGGGDESCVAADVTEMADSPAACWSVCADGRRVTSIEAGRPDMRGDVLVMDIAVDYTDSDGVVTRQLELWQLAEEQGQTTLQSISPIDPAPIETVALSTATSYQLALASGLYDQAGALLGNGGADFGEREDLAGLPGAPGFADGLEASLEQLCDSGGACGMPISATVTVKPGGLAADVSMTVRNSTSAITYTLTVVLYEGTPAIRGVPPVAAPA
jgi:hypothetical protein